MPNRIIKESICTSEDIDNLTWFEEVLFYRLIVTVDDYGLFDGRIKILKARLFPLKSVTEKQIEEAINKLESAGMVHRYQVDGAPFLQILAWANHQQIRNKKSKYPKPEQADTKPSNMNAEQLLDINGKQMKSNEIKCPRNPIQSNTNPNPNPNPNTNTNPETKAGNDDGENKKDSLEVRFNQFWKIYPIKVGKKRAKELWKKINPDRELTEKIVQAIQDQKKTDQWTKDGGRFIPHPSTWLNQGRWEDDVETYPKPSKRNTKSDNCGNFTQREYTSEFFDSLVSDIDDLLPKEDKN